MPSREENLYSQALELEKEGEITKATDLYQEILKINPRNERAIQRLSVIQNMSERKKKLREPIAREAYLHITRKDGSKEDVDVRGESVAIGSKSNYIVDIDLSALCSCPNLYSFTIQGNRLDHINLKPLGCCSHLQSISLSGNGLPIVDLSPLGSCSSLQYLYVAYNKLQSIDLSPLSSCPISHIDLCKNELQSVDMTPVIFSPYLSRIDTISRLVIDSQETALSSWIRDPFPKRPLFGQTRGESERISDGELSYSVNSPVPLGSWELLRKLAFIPQSLSIPIQSFILKALNLEVFGLIDTDILKSLRTIPPQTSIDRAREILRPLLVETICEQIDRGGTTIGLDVEALCQDFGDIAHRSDTIAEMREHEIERTGYIHFLEDYESDMIRGIREAEVERRGHSHLDPPIPRYDVSHIALTAYGYSIVTSLSHMKVLTLDKSAKGKMAMTRDVFDRGAENLFYDAVLERSLIVDENDFTRIRKAVSKLGYNLSERPHYRKQDLIRRWYEPKNMSIQMMHYVHGLVIHGWPDTPGWS